MKYNSLLAFLETRVLFIPHSYNGGYRQPHYYYRRRRQVESENEEDPRIEQLFQMALEKDTSGCILQMTCFIGTMAPSSLDGHAQVLHTILRSVEQDFLVAEYAEMSDSKYY